MNPPIDESLELYSIKELNTVNKIIELLKQTSTKVSNLTYKLSQNHDNKCLQTKIKRKLVTKFESALSKGDVRPEIVHKLAKMHARITVNDIRMVVVAHGASIVVYFLCKTVKSFYELDQMIKSGFMREVFAVVIESLERTTVDVYVKDDEFNVSLLGLSSAQDKGLSINQQY